MRLLLALLAAGTATPALAQHADHGAPQPAPPPPRQQPAQDPHAGHHSPAQPAQDPRPGHHSPPQPTQDPHAGHDAPAQPAQDPRAGHHSPGQDPHAGHEEPAPAAADPHASHGSGQPDRDSAHEGHAAPGHEPAAPAPPVAPPPAGAFSGPEHAADTAFGPSVMAAARRNLLRSHGDMPDSRFRLERLEVGFGEGHEIFAWEGDFFIGTPIDRLWLKSEGEGEFGGELEQGEVQALWGRAVSAFFDLQAGIRYDFAPDPNRAHLVLGLQGVAPYWFEIDAALFLSDEGELTARAEVEYDLLITQRLILQPKLEIDLSAQDVPELGIGAGLTSAEAGLRLRYEIRREFAPYVGVQYERSLGRTAGLRAAAGEDKDALTFLAGLRFWF